MASRRGPKRGRLTPPQAAARPRQKMAMLNAQAAWAFVQPPTAMTGCWK